MISNLERMKREQFSNFWGFGNKTDVDKAISKINQENFSSGEAAIVASGQGSVNDGRRTNDGSVNWENILQAGADVVSQFGNQNQVEQYDEQDWKVNNSDNSAQDDSKSETKILGMHPVTFGAVAIGVLAVSGFVWYKVSSKSK